MLKVYSGDEDKATKAPTSRYGVGFSQVS